MLSEQPPGGMLVRTSWVGNADEGIPAELAYEVVHSTGHPLRNMGLIHDAELEVYPVDAFELRLVHHDVALSVVGVYSRVVL